MARKREPNGKSGRSKAMVPKKISKQLKGM